MAKYSVDSSNDTDNSEDNSCSMCGSTENISEREVAGANVMVCSSCKSPENNKDSEYNSGDKDSEYNSGDKDSNMESNNKESKGYTITKPDSGWVEKNRPNYGNAKTPYMVDSYHNKIREVMEKRGVSKKQVIEDTPLNESTLDSIINGNAISDSVGKKPITIIEEYFDIEIREDR